jgi:hypothetical protein
MQNAGLSLAAICDSFRNSHPWCHQYPPVLTSSAISRDADLSHRANGHAALFFATLRKLYLKIPRRFYPSLFFYVRCSTGHATVTRPSNALCFGAGLLSISRLADLPPRCRFSALAHRRYFLAATACTPFAALIPSGPASRSQWRCLLSPPPTSSMPPPSRSLAASYSADSPCHQRPVESSIPLPRTATLFP